MKLLDKSAILRIEDWDCWRVIIFAAGLSASVLFYNCFVLEYDVRGLRCFFARFLFDCVKLFADSVYFSFYFRPLVNNKLLTLPEFEYTCYRSNFAIRTFVSSMSSLVGFLLPSYVLPILSRYGFSS